MAGTSATANTTYWKSALGVQKSDGTYVDVVDASGNITAPVSDSQITLTGTSANIFSAGRQGTTNPVLNVDTSTASVVTGLNLKGAAAAGGMAVSVTSSGTNENLTIDAKGSGTLTLNGTATGAIALARATGVTGALTGTSASASALAIGRQGATNPALQVDASTASSLTGLKITAAGTGAGVALAAVETGGTNNSLTLDAMGSGSLGLNTASGATGPVNIGSGTNHNGASIQGPTTVSSASTGALNVGPNGTTNPALHVDASAASAATGLSITSAAAAGGLALAAISSGTDENLTIDAKGAGTLTLNATATGNIVMGRAMTGVSSSMTGAFTGKSGTAVPATAGAVAAGAPLVMNSNGMTIEWTTDAPTHTRPKGSVCININGSSSSTRMYINTDGAGTWTSVTTAA